MGTVVSTDNFVRAETARMFHDLQLASGGVNVFRHNRRQAPIDEQTVIRLNRDTLYSFAVVDLTGGVTLSLPDTGGRYLSVMVVDEDHYVAQVLHERGEHRLTAEDVGSGHALLAVRTLVDPDVPEDLAAVAAIQDAVGLTAGSAEPYVMPDYDEPSLDETRQALLVLARNLQGFGRMFGSRDQVDPVRHLIGTAAGWGGLPSSEAVYLGVDPRVPPGTYTLTMRDVPADAFWSVSVYNAAGYFEPNASGRYSLNSISATGREGTGSSDEVVVRFVPDDSVTGPNTLPVPGEGWNYLVRLYRPRAEVLDGRWTLPRLEPAHGCPEWSGVTQRVGRRSCLGLQGAPSERQGRRRPGIGLSVDGVLKLGLGGATHHEQVSRREIEPRDGVRRRIHRPIGDCGESRRRKRRALHADVQSQD